MWAPLLDITAQERRAVAEALSSSRVHSDFDACREHHRSILRIDSPANFCQDLLDDAVPRRRSDVSIFIASMVNRTSPVFTASPVMTAIVETTPGIGAATWHRCRLRPSGADRQPATARLGIFTSAAGRSVRKRRGPAFVSVSPIACNRTTSALPCSISTAISSPDLHAVEKHRRRQRRRRGHICATAARNRRKPWDTSGRRRVRHRRSPAATLLALGTRGLRSAGGSSEPGRTVIGSRPSAPSSAAPAASRRAAGRDRRAACRPPTREGDVPGRVEHVLGRQVLATIISAMSPTTLEDGVTLTMSPNRSLAAR